MNNIDVTIIVPVYNVENYLRKCMDSILSQTFRNFEIISINDGSTDGCSDILDGYAKDNNNVVVINQKNQGLAVARNSGIKAARGKYLAFVDSDDYIDSEMINAMYQRAQNEGSDIVICRYEQVYEDGSVHYTSGITADYSKGELFKRVLAGKISGMACDKLYKTSLFLDNNIFYPKGLYHEDLVVTFKLFYYAKNISVIEKVFYYWLRREGSISRTASKKHVEDIFEMLEMTESFFKEQ